MTPHPSPRETRLRAIRTRMTLAAPLQMAFSDGCWMLEWRDPVTQERGAMASFAQDIPHDQVHVLAAAQPDGAFLLELLDEAFATIRQIKAKNSQQPGAPATAAGPRSDPQKNYSAEAAMKCADPQFIAYLADLGLLGEDPEETAITEALRQALKIKSRSELNAAGRWLAFRQDFEDWKRGGNQEPETERMRA
tara:strand:- start:62 stop:640 length:579 start_codon:yes stop_codon:yes gene_type:complete